MSRQLTRCCSAKIYYPSRYPDFVNRFTETIATVVVTPFWRNQNRLPCSWTFLTSQFFGLWQYSVGRKRIVLKISRFVSPNRLRRNFGFPGEDFMSLTCWVWSYCRSSDKVCRSPKSYFMSPFRFFIDIGIVCDIICEGCRMVKFFCPASSVNCSLLSPYCQTRFLTFYCLPNFSIFSPLKYLCKRYNLEV